MVAIQLRYAESEVSTILPVLPEMSSIDFIVIQDIALHLMLVLCVMFVLLFNSEQKIDLVTCIFHLLCLNILC